MREQQLFLNFCSMHNIEALRKVNCRLSAWASFQQAMFRVLCCHLGKQQYGWPYSNSQSCIAMALHTVSYICVQFTSVTCCRNEDSIFRTSNWDSVSKGVKK